MKGKEWRAEKHTYKQTSLFHVEHVVLDLGSSILNLAELQLEGLQVLFLGDLLIVFGLHSTLDADGDCS